MTKLNRGLQQQIAAAIRAGGFGHIAAQSFGVSRKSYLRWRKLGRSNESDEPFHSFARGTEEALGQARLRAEMTVFGEQPRIWLQNGPGRETSDNPGWTVAVKPAGNRGDELNILTDKAMAQWGGRLYEILSPFPEARAAIAGALRIDFDGERRA